VRNFLATMSRLSNLTVFEPNGRRADPAPTGIGKSQCRRSPNEAGSYGSRSVAVSRITGRSRLLQEGQVAAPRIAGRSRLVQIDGPRGALLQIVQRTEQLSELEPEAHQDIAPVSVRFSMRTRGWPARCRQRLSECVGR
jgi:hypothetical protein